MRPARPEAPSGRPAGTQVQGVRRRHGGGAGRDVVAVLGGYLLLGVVAGVLWWLLVDPAEFTVAADRGLGMGEVELAKRFGDDGWFAVVAAVLGAIAGGAMAWWRSRDPLLTAVLVLGGSVLAAVVMALLGDALGPADPETVAAGLPVGARVPERLTVSGFADYLVWPIASLAGTLLVLWSPGPGPEPDPVRR